MLIAKKMILNFLFLFFLGYLPKVYMTEGGKEEHSFLFENRLIISIKYEIMKRGINNYFDEETKLLFYCPAQVGL